MITSYSGYRLQFLKPELYGPAWDLLMERITPQFEYFEAALKQAPLLVDDCLKNVHPDDMIRNGLRHGEMFMCYHNEHPVGFMGLLDIMHERSAKFEAFGDPYFRSTYRGRKILATLAHELIEYAFKPFGPIEEGGGLGLLKLKAEVARTNEPALKACRALGFKLVGISPFDGFYHSQPVDMVLLELWNPEFLRTLEAAYEPTQEPANVVPDGASLPAAGAICGTAGPTDGSTAGDERTGNNAKRKRSRKARATVAPIHESEPNGPGGAVGL